MWGLTGAFALFLVPMLLGDLLARFRSTNWILWLQPDGLWINLRSYQNHHLDDAPVVAFLEYREIASAGLQIQSFSTPATSGRGTRTWKVQSLHLRLKHAETQPMRDALAAERKAPPATRNCLGVKVSSRATHFAVTLPADDLIRIAWRGGTGNSLAPRLKHVLQQLALHVEVTEASRQQHGDWRQLSDAEVGDQILALVQTGATFEAVRLLKQRKGYTIAEARRFVDELAARM